MRKVIAISINNTASNIFQRLLLNRFTGLAKIKIPASSNAKNAPINAKRIINFGIQTTNPK